MTLCSGYIRERKPRSIDTVVFVTVDAPADVAQWLKNVVFFYPFFGFLLPR